MSVPASLDQDARAPDAAAPAASPPVRPLAQSWPRPAAAWWTVAMLSVVLMLSQIDRNIITLLVSPIKRDMHLTDAQVGLFGPAFMVLYIFMGLPLSRITDTGSRRLMIGIGLTFWSLMTAACGLAHNFTQLFLARVGIGAGESVNGPATYSMLADNFPRERLPRALAALNVGFVFGTGFTYIAAGLLIGALSASSYQLPLVGTVHGWQLVFMYVGLPGLIFAALMATVPEPHRRGVAGEKPKAPPVREVVRYLSENRRFYASMIGGIGCSALVTAGVQFWNPAFYERTYGWSARQVGGAIGAVLLISSSVGLLTGPWLAERLARRHDDANLRVALLAYLVALPFHIIGPLMPTPWLAMGCWGVGTACIMTGANPYVAAMQSVTPNRMRAQVSALYLFVFSGIAFAFGSSVFGAITDFIVRDEQKIRYTLAGASAVFSPLAILIISFARKPYGRMVAELKAAEAGAG
jgi:MFS family permease